MSISPEPPPPPQMPNEDSRPPLPPQRSGFATALMFLVGVILLLPGLCAIIFGVGTLSSSHLNPVVMVLVVFGLLIGFGGIMLIRSAILGPES